MTTRKIVINREYEYLREFIHSLPQIFSAEGERICKRRNEIKTFDVGGLRLNVKQYCTPRLMINRLVYTSLRSPKAQRAYEHALRLRELNVMTPPPVAYIIERSHALLSLSYFISLHLPHSRNLCEFATAELDDEVETICHAFGRYTATLHRLGILHRDYSPGNILFEMVDSAPDFCLVDINRMSFGRISPSRGCANFGRIWGTPEIYRAIARSYAHEMQLSEEHVYARIIEARRAFALRQRFKFKRKRDPTISP